MIFPPKNGHKEKVDSVWEKEVEVKKYQDQLYWEDCKCVQHNRTLAETKNELVTKKTGPFSCYPSIMTEDWDEDLYEQHQDTCEDKYPPD